MAWKQSHNPKKYQANQIILALVLLAILVIVGFVSWWFFIREDSVTEVATTPIEPAVSTDQPEEIAAEQLPEPEPQPVFDAAAITTTLDDWVAATPGTASVVISDTDGTVLASTLPDRVYFAASIYKLYVAYEGYRQIDNGEADPNEVYLNGNTRAACLDLMIRESDSPCAEKMWIELGKQQLTDQLEVYGLQNTSMTGIRTSAADAALMLALIARGEGLSASSQQAFLESMRTQVFRDALNKGFSDEVTVYNKIGFNGFVEYHDTTIIQLADGRQLVVSVFTENVGTSNIAALATAIEKEIAQ